MHSTVRKSAPFLKNTVRPRYLGSVCGPHLASVYDQIVTIGFGSSFNACKKSSASMSTKDKQVPQRSKQVAQGSKQVEQGSKQGRRNSNRLNAFSLDRKRR